MVYFDLPTKTRKDKRNYSVFRKGLLKDGYQMVQFSVYARPCVSHERQKTHTRRIKLMIPPRGQVRCMFVTNIQWEKTFVFFGSDEPTGESEQMPEQLLLW